MVDDKSAGASDSASEATDESAGADAPTAEVAATEVVAPASDAGADSAAPDASADAATNADDDVTAEDSAEAATAEDEAADDEQASEEAIAALAKLSAPTFYRMCQRIPLRLFLAEVQRLDRGLYFRYFKGYRPVKITPKRLEEVFRKEIFAARNGMLAQLVIYNWDEAEWRLYRALQDLVKEINEDVEAIETISDAEGDGIFDTLEAEYDKRDVAVAAVINGVRVSDAYLSRRFEGLVQFS